MIRSELVHTFVRKIVDMENFTAAVESLEHGIKLTKAGNDITMDENVIKPPIIYWDSDYTLQSYSDCADGWR